MPISLPELTQWCLTAVVGNTVSNSFSCNGLLAPNSCLWMCTENMTSVADSL